MPDTSLEVRHLRARVASITRFHGPAAAEQLRRQLQFKVLLDALTYKLRDFPQLTPEERAQLDGLFDSHSDDLA